MADSKKSDTKAAPGPAENKSLSPQDDAAKVATTEQGAKQAEAREQGLSAAQKKRQQELAQSGYRLPDSFFQGEAEQVARDKAIAKQMPNGRDAAEGK